MEKTYSDSTSDLGSDDPKSVLQGISKALEFAGGIADVFGPEGEAVGVPLQAVGAILDVVSSFMGNGPPSETEIIRKEFERVTGALEDIKNKIAEVENLIKEASIKTNVIDTMTDIWYAIYVFRLHIEIEGLIF